MFRTVPVHTGEQDFTRAAPLHFKRPFDRIQTGRVTAAVGKNFPAGVFGIDGFGINSDDYRLRSEKSGGFIDQIGMGNGGGIDADLVRTGIKQAADIGYSTHAAANG